MTIYCPHCEWSVIEGTVCSCAGAVEERRIEDLESRVEELENRLRDIGDIAHAQSSGPAEPDWLWEIRGLAYEML